MAYCLLLGWISIMAAWAVDREFVHIVGPAGAPFGRLGPHPIGTLLGRLWPAFGHLGTPLGSMWSALGPREAFGSPIERQAGSGDLASTFVCKITIRSEFLALETGATGATGATEVVSKTVAQTPLPTHAGGQDDVSLKQTPSNNICAYEIPYIDKY